MNLFLGTLAGFALIAALASPVVYMTLKPAKLPHEKKNKR